MGRLRAVTNGRFRKTQVQGPLLGSELEKGSVTYRPKPARQVSPKLPDAPRSGFAFRSYEAAVRGLRQPATSSRPRPSASGQGARSLDPIGLRTAPPPTFNTWV